MADRLFQGEILIFDGAVGTELYERGFYINRPFEELNLSAPADVTAVHEGYVRAGAQVLTTNTFSITGPQLKKFDIETQQEKLLCAGIDHADQARKNTDAKVGLSIGPLGVLVEPLGSFGLDEARQEFKKVAEIAVRHGKFDLYILETFSNVNELNAAIDGIRAADSTRPILASMSIRSIQNEIIEAFAEKIGKRPDVQALGLNCSDGPSDLFTSAQKLIPLLQKPLIVQPNAGVPRHVNGRYFYMTSPDYLAKYAKRYVELGVQGVGGCCGTSSEHIRAIRNAVRMANSKRTEKSPGRIEILGQAVGPKKSSSSASLSPLAQSLGRKEKVISIELLPPKGTDLTKFKTGMDSLIRAGVKFINVPDGARASTRVGSLHLAAAVRRDYGDRLTVIPHLTTRDRNLIALQADLIGASINGIHEVLIVTGDPPKLGNNREATAVYDIDAIGLTYLTACLNRGTSPNGDSLGTGTSFTIGVASNPTSINPELELKRWGYKVESGADFSITQPIFDAASFLRWKDQIQKNYRPHLVGIWPLVSLRNAEFMANEVPGVHVPKWVIQEMEKAGEDKEEAMKRGIEIARKVIDELTPHCEGFCVSAPLGRSAVALEVIR
jgi:methionine synthase I (cobalamin-dependent)/5,10-methylenetetrahydrofolate reductase